VNPFKRKPNPPDDKTKGFFPCDRIDDFNVGSSIHLNGKKFQVVRGYEKRISNKEELGYGRDGKVYRVLQGNKHLAAKVHRAQSLQGAHHEFAVAREMQDRARRARGPCVQHWFLPEQLHATSKGSWKKAVVLMPTAETCLSVWTLNDTGEVVAAAVLHGILAALSEMHSLGFLHGDVKPDNFLLVPTTPGSKLEQLPLPVKIVGIDLGRAIDVQQEPAAFQSKQHIDPYRCPEMKNNERWMYQIDSYGAAAVAFGMIFDDFTMKVESAEHVGVGYYRLKKRIPEGMQTEMWGSIFGGLLNGALGETSGKFFHLQRLAELRQQLREFVVKNKAATEQQLLDLLREGPRD
jgi:hypothetical protein